MLSLSTILLEMFKFDYCDDNIEVHRKGFAIVVTLKTSSFHDFSLLTKLFLREQKNGIEFMDVYLHQLPKQRIKYFVLIDTLRLRVGNIPIHTVTVVNRCQIIGMFQPISSFWSYKQIADMFKKNPKYRRQGFVVANTFFYNGRIIDNEDNLWSDGYDFGKAIILRQ
jgi:hypothetical protein